MDKPINFPFSAATAIFIFLALAQTLFLPILGGMSGFSILAILTAKFIIGKIKEKTLEKNQPKGAGDGGAIKELAKTKGNLYMLAIIYLTTPMNKFEKGILLLGWALWPIFFPLMLMVILAILKEQCTILKVDGCSAFNVF